MSKATNVRKKALELVRQQDWQGAIREYKRLVEMDQSNPNVHNELADIYLKTNSKSEAYDSFVRAIDEYTRVGLYNNAVAVAKKVIRVLPVRTEVLVLLGNVRVKQGLPREAESYYNSFLEKAAVGNFEAAAFKKLAREMAEATPDSVPVLHKLSLCLLSFQLDEEAGEILLKLHVLVSRNGDGALLGEVRQSIERLGLIGRISPDSGATPDPHRTVVTEDTIWTRSHSPGERIEIESTPRFAPPSGTEEAASPTPAPAEPKAPAQPAQPKPAEPPADGEPVAPAGPSEKELYLLRLARGVGSSSVAREKREKPAGATAAKKSWKEEVRPEPEAADHDAPAVETAAPEHAVSDVDAVGDDAVETVDTRAAATETVPAARDAATDHPVPPVRNAGTVTMPRPEAPTRTPEPVMSAAPEAPRTPTKPAAGDHTQISALIDDEAGGESNDDYRSHYDLGMAYMEMGLMAEAIREYQTASRSPQFQVKCLEMIGACFIQQNQPQLAIRQLSKGLAMIDTDSEESLGMKYNLGLAYEMVGEVAKARAQFEDVYVVDVTFRDVAEKVARLGEDS